MQQVTRNVFAETQVRGCNHGFVTTSEGVVMIDSPQKPTDALKWRAEVEKHGQLKYIINTEPHGDHWTGNAYFDAPVVAHEGVRTRILETDLEEHLVRVGSMGPKEPKLLEGYSVNVPVITFQNGMTMHVGDHTFEMIHMPGHTLYQAAILIKEEGVVFTSDNIFHQAQTCIQEANPHQWLNALNSLRYLDKEIFIPGYRALCDKGYLDEQGTYIMEWVEYVRKAVERGMTKEETIENLTDMTDRYPMDVGQDGTSPRVMKMNVANLYDFTLGEGIHSTN